MSRIRIGSFNVRNLADGEGRDLDRIAKMINYYHLDIVALQEVLAEGKILSGITLKDPVGEAKAYVLCQIVTNFAWAACTNQPNIPYVGAAAAGLRPLFLCPMV